jgi:hypothetical protein
MIGFIFGFIRVCKNAGVCSSKLMLFENLKWLYAVAECRCVVITYPNTSKFEMITFKITNFLFNFIPLRKLFIEVVNFRLFQALADIGPEHLARTSLFMGENANQLK